MELRNNDALPFALLAVFFIFYFALITFLIIAQWKVYTKAGKPGWACLVPFYNYIVMLEIVGKPVWWFVLMLVPIVNIVIGIMVINLLAKSFGKDVGFTLGLIFLPFIFLPILAFGSAKYQGPAGLNS